MASARHRLKEKLAQADRATLYLLVKLFLLLSLLLGFAELSDDVLEGDTHHIDMLILSFFRLEGQPDIPIGPTELLLIARDITALGGHAVLALVTLVAAGYCFLIHRYSTIALIFAAAGGGMAISASLKWAFARPRPDIVPHLVEVSSASFPSGHAMLSAAIYLSLAAILAQIASRRRQKLYIMGIALLLTGIIGLSRVYLGVHYPSDVIAGWMIGIAWALCCGLVSLWLTSHMKKRTQSNV